MNASIHELKTAPVPAPSRETSSEKSAATAPADFPQTVNAGDVHSARSRGDSLRILDVRTAGEYAGCHVAGTETVPLDQLDARQWLQGHHPAMPVFVLCQSGGRARRAATALRDAGLQKCAVIEGGIDAWIHAGLPVVRGNSTVLPLMRQVQLVVGIVSATGAALALWQNPWYALIPLGTGLGLTLAGATGLCPLASLLARMPWNRQPTSPQKKVASCCSTHETA